jgi:AcrR family transcriptional regulator
MADHRFERTDTDIRRAFMAALTKQGFETLTVAGLARLSKVDRTTFYAHYESLFTLAERVITDQVALLRTTLIQGGLGTAAKAAQYQLFSETVIAQLSQQTAAIRKLRLISLGTQSFDAQCRRLFAAIYQQVLGVDPNSFTGFLLVNIAMSDLDFILLNQRAPARTELAASLDQLIAIARGFK